jgi:tetratricopeptide (TPR) repeat protein
MGNYYYEKGNLALANSYFLKANDNLCVNYFKKDSSSFYALRGWIRAKLDTGDAISDFERSLNINPNDSLALLYYPLVLLSKGKIAEVRKLCLNDLEHNSTSISMPLGMLVTIAIGESIQSMQKEIHSDENKRGEYRKMDYNQLFDFSFLEKYDKKLNISIEMKNAMAMADILKLYTKIFVFEYDDNEDPIMGYTPRDLRRLEELKEWFIKASENNQLNDYALNKNLGYIYFMLNNRDEAIPHFTKAIEVYSLLNGSGDIDVNESYNALLTIYYYKNDTTNYRKTIQRKISQATPPKEPVADYRNLAYVNFLNGQLEKAKQYAEKSRNLDFNDFDTARLLAHLYFLDGKSFMTEFYGNEAGRLVSSPIQGYKVSMQHAIYLLFNGDANAAFQNIEMARKAYQDNYSINSKCELCDTLITNYIKIVD